MANNLLRNPWILDTASATPVKRGRTLTTGFVFQGYTGGSASLAVLKDIRGLIIANLVGAADGSSVGIGWLVPQAVEDLALTTIDSGTVEVIVR